MKISNKTIYFIIFIFTGVLILICMLDYYFLYTGDADMDLSVDVLWNTLEGKFLYSNYYNMSFLGDHFSLILIPLIPFYYLWTDPRTLLFLQIIVSSLGALAIYWLAREKLKSEFAALSFALVFLLAPLRLNELTITFSTYHFGATFMLFTFYFLQKRNFKKASIFFFLLLFCKEDTFIFGAFIGLYAFFILKERKFGLFIMIISILWGFSVIEIIQPHFRGDKDVMLHNYFARRYGYLGQDFSSALKTLFFHPIYVLKILFTLNRFIKLRSLCCLFIPVACLSFLGIPQFIFLTLPPLLEMFLSSNKVMNGLLTHYSAFVYPFVFVSAIYGAVKIVDKYKRATIIGGVILFTGIMSSYYFGPDVLPLARNFNFSKYRFSNEIQTAHKVLGSIPEGSSICLRKPYVLYLVQGHKTVMWRGRGIPLGADYLLIDERDHCSPDLVRVLHKGEYGVKMFENGYILLEKGYNNERNEEVFEEVYGEEVFEPRELLHRIGRKADSAWVGEVSKDQACHLAYGPYLERLAGEYQVNYTLKTNDNTSFEIIAKIDVCKDEGRIILEEREIKGVDFKSAGEYETFSLSFSHSGQGRLEFRVFFADKADLWIDRITLSHADLSLEEVYNSL